MYDAVSDCLDFVEVFDASDFGVGEVVKYKLYADSMFWHRVVDLYFFSVG